MSLLTSASALYVRPRAAALSYDNLAVDEILAFVRQRFIVIIIQISRTSWKFLVISIYKKCWGCWLEDSAEPVSTAGSTIFPENSSSPASSDGSRYSAGELDFAALDCLNLGEIEAGLLGPPFLRGLPGAKFGERDSAGGGCCCRVRGGRSGTFTTCHT